MAEIEKIIDRILIRQKKRVNRAILFLINLQLL